MFKYCLICVTERGTRGRRWEGNRDCSDATWGNRRRFKVAGGFLGLGPKLPCFYQFLP